MAMISCSKDSQLDRTIFIPDESEPSLPAYSEWGYNVFGAKHERTYFVANQNIIPCKIMYRDDFVHFLLQGYYGNNPRQAMSLTIIFPYETINDYSDLLTFHKKTIDLSSNCVVKILLGGNERILNVTRGNLEFRRVQLLSVDDVVNRIILSGTFEFQFIGENSFPESFSDGRFDFGITSKDFYSY